MWPRFTLYDLRVIGHYMGTLIMFSSIMYLVPFVLGLLCMEWEPAARYLLSGGLCFCAGALLRFLRIEPGRLNRQQAMVVTGMSWIILALFASVPLYASGHFATYLDAVFDGVSGLTTTGATVMLDIDHLSNADNMFRFMLHFFGGLGLIVIALSFGLFKGAGASLYSSEGRSEHVMPNILNTTQFIFRIAMGFIVAAALVLFVMLLFAGMPVVRAGLHAVWIAISGFLTGGFTPMSQSIMYYHSFPIELALMIVMILGSLNFVLHLELWKGHLGTVFRDIEVRTMVLWLLATCLIFSATLTTTSLFTELPAMLRRGVFLLISAFSTTGFQTITTNQLTTLLGSGAVLTLACIMAVGGSSGGTSGGIKLRRIGIVLKSVTSTVKEALSPDSARVVVAYNHVGRHVLTSQVVREASTVFILYVTTYMIGSLAGVAHGFEASQAIFDSIAMASNGGLSAGIVSPGMPIGLEVVYILEMWAGRLEFITLLALAVKVVVSLRPRWFDKLRNARQDS